MKKLIVFVLLFACLQGFPQENYEGPENTRVEMADQLRSNGKIYVVVAVLGTILAGIVIYTVMLDRRVARLERNSGDQ
jgi:hypothetical protein